VRALLPNLRAPLAARNRVATSLVHSPPEMVLPAPPRLLSSSPVRTPLFVRAATSWVAIIVMAAGLAGCGGDEVTSLDRFTRDGPDEMARLAVKVDAGDERAAFFADRHGAFYYDALAQPQQEEAMGLRVGGFRVLDGWRWWFPVDSVGLGPAQISRALVRPDYAVRAYTEVDTAGFLPRLIRRYQGPEPKRLRETITLVDSALVVSVPDSVGTVELFPVMGDRPSDGYTAEVLDGVLVIARSNYMEARGDDPRPVWLAVAADGGRPRVGRVDIEQRYPGSLGARDRAGAPGRVRFDTPGAVAFAYGMTQEEAVAAARRALDRRDAALDARRQWLAGAFRGAFVRTEDEDFNRAYQWARITLQQLVRGDSAEVDLASGIPGLEGRHGWNTVQAMEGAFLVTGQWERAAGMLRKYARNQRFDRRIDFFGRAPSRFDHLGRPVFRTADGGAVLVGALGDYLRTTGHDGLVLGERRLFWTNPVYVQRGYDDRGQLRSPAGLIRSTATETWVPRVASRDGRAREPEVVEVQGRYIENLRTMERLAMIMGVRRQAEAYRDSINAFQRRFERAFLQDDLLVDYRGPDGTPSTTPRPSALFALRAFDLDPDVERRVLRRLAGDLAYEHGVATRPQGDSLFYPFLTEPDFYEPDDARWDGTVWTALSGPLISLLVQHGAHERAHEQGATLARYVTERGAVGGIPENVDAHPRETDEGRTLGIGGAPVQPWSLAELLRVAHQDFAGVRYQAGNDVILQPSLPASWGETITEFRMGNGWVRAHLRQRGSALDVSLVPRGQMPRDARVRVRGYGHEQAIPLTRPAGDGAVAAADSTALQFTADGVSVNGESVSPDGRYQLPDEDFWADFTWAEPELLDDYPVMQRLEQERRLTADQVARYNPMARTILTRTDPVGDDWGRTATFTYPTNYPPRILDATYLEIAEDAEAFYFTIEMAALAPPDEFGHQPTFFALALNTEEGGQTTVGRGANFTFDRGSGYNYIVFIGDGIRLEDDRGRVLGEFENIGEDVVDVDAGRVQFALPKYVLPALPRRSEVTLMVGANEGGHPGRFRQVHAQASSRFGGGKINPGDPNIYDFITARVGQ
jgi:glycogen debranching enzyme